MVKDFAKSDFYTTFAAVMIKVINKYGNMALSVLVGIGIFLFWYVAYPHA